MSLNSFCYSIDSNTQLQTLNLKLKRLTFKIISIFLSYSTSTWYLWHWFYFIYICTKSCYKKKKRVAMNTSNVLFLPHPSLVSVFFQYYHSVIINSLTKLDIFKRLRTNENKTGYTWIILYASMKHEHLDKYSSYNLNNSAEKYPWLFFLPLSQNRSYFYTYPYFNHYNILIGFSVYWYGTFSDNNNQKNDVIVKCSLLTIPIIL